MKELLNFSITPLHLDHLEEICQDVKLQVEGGVAKMPLFSMSLVPEGCPPVDKVGPFLEKYALFKARLAELGIPCGILVQATIGHGRRLAAPSPFQKVVGLLEDAGDVTCPYDEGFRAHMREVFAKVAAAGPAHIMVDDDLRLIARSAGGCACPAHLAAFNRLAGTDLQTPQQLAEALRGEHAKQYTDLFAETQREALLGAARAMREGIDAVDKRIPGSFSGCGNNIEFGEEIAALLAGEGNPVTIRINNGNYTPAGARYLSKISYRAAIQAERVRHKADVILAETDTCPQNRYSTGAYSLHAHFVASVLEGASGAKHWITRMFEHEPESGAAYRRVLTRYNGFYRRLATLVPTLQWLGCRIPLSTRRTFLLEEKGWATSDGGGAFAALVLERLGIPLYFSAKPGGAVFLCGRADEKFTDEELLEMLKGPAFLAVESAVALHARGLGEHLGVAVEQKVAHLPRGEVLHPSGKRVGAQVGTKTLLPCSPAVKIHSTVYQSTDGTHREPMFPGVTSYQNALGGTAVVFCGTPIAKFHYLEAFSFLNQSRKAQLVDLLTSLGQLPAYYEQDEEVYLRAAACPDGSLFLCLFNIGLDPIDEIRLWCEKSVASVQLLSPDGAWEDADFTADGHHLCVKAAANILTPVCMLLKG